MKKIVFTLIGMILVGCSAGSPTTQSTTGPVVAPVTTLQPGTVLQTPDAATWGKLNLKGQLIFILYDSHGNTIVQLDLLTGELTSIFQAPQDAQLNAAILSPDGKQLAVAYAPPPDSAGNFTFSSLFLLPVDGSAPLKQIIPGVHPDDAFYNPAWAPDGQSLYATHFHRGDGTKGNPDGYSVDRVTLDGKTSTIIPGAIWPMIDPSGIQMAYLTARVDSPNNVLSVAGLDGSAPTALVTSAGFTTEDYHFFSPNGKTVYFSAVSTAAASPSIPSLTWLDRLLDVRVVSAHNLPSDWYRVGLDGSTPERLTKFQEAGLSGAFSPDGQHLALLSQTNLYLANPDGSGLEKLLGVTGFGTIQWAP